MNTREKIIVSQVKAIMADGLELGRFVEVNKKTKLVLNNGIHKEWLPYIFERAIETDADMNSIMYAWIKERVYPKNRIGAFWILMKEGLIKHDVMTIAKRTRCSLVTDPYWLVYDDNDTYNEQSIRGRIGVRHFPYNSMRIEDEEKYIWRVKDTTQSLDDDFKEEDIIYWDNKELMILDNTMEYTNGGRISKLWAEDRISGRLFLIKGCTSFGLEPYSEVLAYIIGKRLGIEVLKYSIIPVYMHKSFRKLTKMSPLCSHVSICEKIDRIGCSIMSIAEIKRAEEVIQHKKVTNYDIMYGIGNKTNGKIIEKYYIDQMFMFDALIGNRDRHYGNVHVLRDIDGTFKQPPLIDNGDSLMAKTTLVQMVCNKLYSKRNDEAKTVFRTHKDQIKTITTIKNLNVNITSSIVDILLEVEGVFKDMREYKSRDQTVIEEVVRRKFAKIKSNTMKKYLVYRILNYIGIIRVNSSNWVSKNKEIDKIYIKDEVEHT